MKIKKLLNTTMLLLFLGASPSPALASPKVPEVSNTKYQKITTIQTSSAVVAVFTESIEFQHNFDQKYPVTLLLAQPIMNSTGGIIAPTNSVVKAQIVPTQGGIQIMAEALIISGQVVPIQASSDVIPNITVKVADQERGKDIISAGGAIGGLIDDDGSDGIDTGMLAGTVLATLLDAIAPKQVEFVSITEGSTHILSLNAPVEISVPIQATKPFSKNSVPSNKQQVKTTRTEHKVLRYSEGLTFTYAFPKRMNLVVANGGKSYDRVPLLL